MFDGRGDWIRTSDLPVPNRTLYQAEPRPDITPLLVSASVHSVPRSRTEEESAQSPNKMPSSDDEHAHSMPIRPVSGSNDGPLSYQIIRSVCTAPDRRSEVACKSSWAWGIDVSPTALPTELPVVKWLKEPAWKTTPASCIE